MFCSTCGTQLKKGVLFCPYCGQETQIVLDTDILEDELLKDLMDETDAVSLKQRQRQTLQTEKEELRRKEAAIRAKKKKQNRRSFVILLLLIVVIFAGCFSFVKYKQNHSVSYLMTKAQKAYAQKNYDSALEYLEKVLALDAKDIDALLLEAQIASATKDYETAQSYYLKVLALDSENLTAYKGLIHVYDAQGERELLLALMDDVTDETILSLFEDYIIPVPQFSEESGSFSDYFTVKLTATNINLSIYYTTDGSDPTVDGILYEEEISIDEQGSTTLQAVCMDENGYFSDIVVAVYKVTLKAPDAPVATPSGGQYTTAQSITIAVPTGTTVYYTWGNTTPTSSSSRYTGALTMPEGNNVLSLIAIDENGMCSDVVRYNYIYYPEVTTSTEGTDDATETDFE